MKRLRMPLVLLLVILLAAGAVIHAQDSTASVLVIAYGDGFWFATQDGAVAPGPYPYCGQVAAREPVVSRLVLAPTGTHAAYLVSPLGDAAAQMPPDEVPPTGVVICDGSRQEEYTVAAQPDDLNALDRSGANPVRYNVAGTPAWSPDGTRVAWPRLRRENDATTLDVQIYNLAEEEVTTLPVVFPAQFSRPAPLTMTWMEAGLAVFSNGFNIEILVVDPADGAITARYPLPTADAKGPPTDLLPVETAQGERLALVYADGLVELLDLGTGDRAPLTGRLQVFTPGAPDGGGVFYLPAADATARWEIEAGGGSTVELPVTTPRTDGHVTLAPDGQTVAYLTDSVYLWRNGEITGLTVPPPVANSSLVWAPLRWRVVG